MLPADLQTKGGSQRPRGQGPENHLEGVPIRLVTRPHLDLLDRLADVDHGPPPSGNNSSATPSSPAGMRWLWFLRTSQKAAACRSGISFRASYAQRRDHGNTSRRSFHDCSNAIACSNRPSSKKRTVGFIKSRNAA